MINQPLQLKYLRALSALILLLVCWSCTAKATITETQKLESLAKVWGFLKYYHPTVASGKLNWDQELIDQLPKVRAAQTKEELSQVYVEWIGELSRPIASGNKKSSRAAWNANFGLKKEAEIHADNKPFVKNFDLSWTENKTFFTDELIQVLDVVEHNRAKGYNHYAGLNEHGFINFKNEKPYGELYFKYPDEAYRLLNLFRYWNIIEYFFPYKYKTDQNWDEVFPELIPKFSRARDLDEYHLAVTEMVAKVNDSHAHVSSDLAPGIFGHYWLPVRFKLIGGTAVITSAFNDSLAAVQDIRVGDVVHQVNGVAVSEIIREKAKYISASNQSALYRDFYNAVFNGTTDTVTITFERDGTLTEKQVKRYLFNDIKFDDRPTIPRWKKLEGNIGYVNMGLLAVPDVKKMIQELAICTAIVFDVRNYPTGVMYEVTKYLNSEPREFVKFIVPDVTYPGKYKWVTGRQAGEKNKNAYKGKVVLLVNETTQSQAEFTVMALQTADNVTIIGNQTAGADGNVVFFELVGGIKTRVTGLGVFYPDGKETQRIGIVPDIEVKQTIAGIREGKDEVLEKALEYLKSENSNL